MITRKRKKTWRVSAGERVEAALGALPLPAAGSAAAELLRELGVDVDGQRAAQDQAAQRLTGLTHEQAVEELQRTGGDAHARLGVAVHDRRQGIKRTRRIAKYALVIPKLEALGVPLSPPYTAKKRDSIKRAMRCTTQQADALIRYLRRNPR